MHALIVDLEAEDGVRLGSVTEPKPAPGELVVEVQHVSLNRGDLNDARSGRVPPGAILGSDVAGVVAASAAAGQGPGVGARVVGLTQGAFAQRCAVDAGMVAEVPEE